MRRRLLIPIGGVALLAVGGVAGAYVYFFSGLRTSPQPLALSSPAASASATTSPASASPATTSTIAGTWQIGSGSLAGYRVKEQFVGQTSSHEAVARTSSVTGSLMIAQPGGSYQLTAGTITVQLAGLASVDQVAGYNVTNRDRLVMNALDVGQYPTAVFEAQSVTVPAGTDSGQAVSLSVPGRLTIHGVTKAVTATVQLKLSGSTAQAAGSVAINMSDYGVSPPRAPFTTVQTAVTIEFQLNMTKTT
jgi:polyisoprenoid-binding protein YceI